MELSADDAYVCPGEVDRVVLEGEVVIVFIIVIEVVVEIAVIIIDVIVLKRIVDGTQVQVVIGRP